MLENIFNISNILTVIITAVCTWGGTFLFHRQKKDEMQIANEAARSREWRLLYEESQRDSARKDKKIDELREEITQLRNQLIELERQVQLNTVYRCDKIGCPKRSNPFDPQTKPATKRTKKLVDDGGAEAHSPSDDFQPEPIVE